MPVDEIPGKTGCVERFFWMKIAVGCDHAGFGLKEDVVGPLSCASNSPSVPEFVMVID